MRIVYAPRALRDIDGILDYIRKRSPRGAHNVSIAIEHAIAMCARNPRVASRTDEPQVYRRALGKYRYTIFYRALANDEGIEVALTLVPHSPVQSRARIDKPGGRMLELAGHSFEYVRN